MRSRKERKGTDGFSLIELVIVIAIAAIMVGGAALSINILTTANTKDLANEINSGLTELKAKNISQEKPVYLHVYKYQDSYYMKYTDSVSLTPDDSGKEIGSPAMRVSVTYDVRDDSDHKLSDETAMLGAGGDICIGMAKKDGAFIFFEKNLAEKRKRAAREITVSSSDGSGYIVYMVTDTGNHYIQVK